ncbi:MAG: hypothetical protein IPJ34_20600 [Myxococcales bacterium]|nr:hypothetical protein [Myxococcales bacterium]
MSRTLVSLVGSLLACALVGCGDGSTAAPVEADSSVEETAAEVEPDVAIEAEAGDDAVAETTPGGETGDSAADATVDTAVVDTDKPDDGSGSFVCGTEVCGKKFQICQRAATPASCPTDEAGPCPVGCPGCAELPYNCAKLPGTCFSFPSCGCMLTVLCGSSTKGTCTEVDGAYTVACP